MPLKRGLNYFFKYSSFFYKNKRECQEKSGASIVVSIYLTTKRIFRNMKRRGCTFKTNKRKSNTSESRSSKNKRNRDKRINKMLYFHLPTFLKPKKAQLLTCRFKTIDKEFLQVERQLLLS